MVNKMDNELSYKKIELENDILIAITDIIKDFEARNDISVCGLDVEFLDCTDVGKKCGFIPDSCYVKFY